MKILLKTQATTEDNPLPYCIVTLTPQTTAALLKLRDLFLAAKKQANTLWEMYFWQGLVDSQWYVGFENDDSFTADEINDLDTNEFMLLEPNFDQAKMGDTGRHECEQLVVREDAFCLFCYEKYGGAHVVSESIPFSMIEDGIPQQNSKKRKAKLRKRA